MLVIVGVIIAAIGSVLPSIINTSKIKRTNATLEKYDYSLQGYLIANNRLPCPDTDNDGRENVSAGAGSDCTAYTGRLPYIDLGLSSGNDPFANPVGYAVYGIAGATEVDLTNAYLDANDFLNNGLNAANAEQLAAGGFVANKVHTIFSDINDILDNASRTAQAYVLVSGGQRDIDGANGFYDHINFNGDLQFAAPNKINKADYDDNVIAQNTTYLAGKHFSGAINGGGSSLAFENTDTFCQDLSDNDVDGAIDCADPDCAVTSFCASQSNVTIASVPSIPNGTIGATPSYTFIASGGGSAPLYYWTLNSISAPLSGELAVNYFTGELAGSYNACPGNYALTVQATDRNDGSNRASENFNFTITNGGLGVLPIPTGGNDFTVDNPIFSQSFTLTGATVGNVNWTIDWIGTDPSGLRLSKTNNSATLEKIGSSLGGTFNFMLTVTDNDCPSNTFTTTPYRIEIVGNGIPAPLNAGLVGDWRFNESWSSSTDAVIDSSNENNHGSIVGSLQTRSDEPVTRYIPGTCTYASFDGTGDMIEIAQSNSLAITGQITMAAWVRASDSTGQNMILYHGYGASAPNRAVYFRINDGIIYAGKNEPLIYASAPFSAADLNQWVHYAGVFTGTAWQIYRNATLIASTNTTEGAINANRNWYIGGYENNSLYSFNGSLDEVKLFNRGLSAAEISEIMNDTNDCAMQNAVLPSCGLSPASGLRMTTYNKTGFNNPNNAAEYDNLVNTIAVPANRYGEVIRPRIAGEGNPLGSNDNYLSLFEGYLNIPDNGYYTFAVDGDDAVDITLNGDVITGWYGGHGRNGSANFPKTVALEAGFHQLLFRHEERSGGDSYYMYTQQPNSPMQITPSSLFNYCP